MGFSPRLLKTLFLIFVFLYVFTATSVKQSLQAGSDRTLYDAHGRVMGYVDAGIAQRAVRDSNRRIIGWIDSNTTYDSNRRIIAKSELPGLLFCGKNR